MTNYNDGKRHGHNGGGCPVHPETLVWAIWMDGDTAKIYEGVAGYLDWNETFCPIIAFRVIKEYKGPREFWLWDGEAFENEEDAKRLYLHNTKHNPELKGKPIIHVREVTE